MKNLFFLFFTPLLSSVLLSFFLFDYINARLFKTDQTQVIDSNFIYLENFRNNPYYEDAFLKRRDSLEAIYLLGSSELTGSTDATPYNFISSNYKTKVIGIGHAGNQSFSIFSQLLCTENRLNQAPIVFIISPTWFCDQYAQGTSASLFLEFNSARARHQLLNHDKKSTFYKYTCQRTSDFYSEIASADAGIKLLYLEHKASSSFIHNIFYTPFIYFNQMVFQVQSMLFDEKSLDDSIYTHYLLKKESLNIAWDSLKNASQMNHQMQSTNNTWGIGDEYYAQYIKGNKKAIRITPLDQNQEYQDFKVLMAYIKEKNIHASFVIPPLNPYYYTNLEDLSPTVDSLVARMRSQDFPVLNLWTTDTSTYQKGVLRDIMHFGDLGWYEVNEFIVNTYIQKK